MQALLLSIRQLHVQKTEPGNLCFAFRKASPNRQVGLSAQGLRKSTILRQKVGTSDNDAWEEPDAKSRHRLAAAASRRGRKKYAARPRRINEVKRSQQR